MKVYMKKEHEIFMERNKELREEWIVIWNIIYPGKTSMAILPKIFKISYDFSFFSYPSTSVHKYFMFFLHINSHIVLLPNIF